MTSNREIPFSKPEGRIFFKRSDLDKYMLSNLLPSQTEIKDKVKKLFNKQHIG